MKWLGELFQEGVVEAGVVDGGYVLGAQMEKSSEVFTATSLCTIGKCQCSRSFPSLFLL